MSAKFLKFLTFFCVTVASSVRANDCSLTPINSNPDAMTYQICTSLEHAAKLDISSVSFESDAPQIQIKSWRLITGNHNTPDSPLKTLTFEITIAPVTAMIPQALLHLYFVELLTRIPHHYAIPITINNGTVPITPSEQMSTGTKNQTDFTLSNLKIKKHLLTVLKAPFTGIHYATKFLVSILELILASRLLLFLIILLFGFLMGLVPLFYPSWIILMIIAQKEKNPLVRLRTISTFMAGLLAALLMQLYSYIQYEQLINNSVIFTICMSLFFFSIGLTLTKRITLFNHITVPLFANIPLGLIIGLTSTMLFLKITNTAIPQFIELLRFIMQQRAMPFLVIGLSFFFCMVGFFSYALVQRISKTAWLTELKHAAGFICIGQAIALTSLAVNAYAISIVFSCALSATAFFYGWQSTAQTTKGIRRFRLSLSLVCLCLSLLIITKVLIINFC